MQIYFLQDKHSSCAVLASPLPSSQPGGRRHSRTPFHSQRAQHRLRALVNLRGGRPLRRVSRQTQRDQNRKFPRPTRGKFDHGGGVRAVRRVGQTSSYWHTQVEP